MSKKKEKKEKPIKLTKQELEILKEGIKILAIGYAIHQIKKCFDD